MTIPYLSLIISGLAFVVSLWTRIETFATTQRQKRFECSRQIGTALVAAQICKDQLSDCLDDLEAHRSACGPDIAEVAKSLLIGKKEDLEKDYQIAWNMIKKIEAIAIVFERGGYARIDTAAIEAKIARLNQKRILEESNIRWLKEKGASQILALADPHPGNQLIPLAGTATTERHSSAGLNEIRQRRNAR